jgi:hypothetical protein
MTDILKADEPDYENPPYYRVGLVGCGQDNLDEPAEARNLSTPPYFEAKRDWCEWFCYRWFVVSAKYGVVRPDEEIEPYEQALSDLSDDGKRLWREKVQRQLQALLSTVYGTPHSHEVVLLMGDSGDNDYRTQVREALRGTSRGYFAEDEHVAVWSPFEEVEEARGGNGNQMGWLKSEVERAEKGQVGQTDVGAWS